LRGHTRYAYLVAFHPDGSLLASTSWDETVRLWDPLTGELLATLPAPKGQFRLSFTSDGTRIIGQSVWDPAAGVRIGSPRTQADHALFEAVAYEWRPEKRRYNVIIRVASGNTRLVGGAGERVALSWDRSLIADGLETGEVNIDDRVRDKTVRRIGRPGAPVRAVSFSPDGSKVVSGNQEGTVTVFRIADGSELATMHGHTAEIFSVNFSPDGSRIVTAGNDGMILIWDASTFEQLLALEPQASYVHSVQFSPDGTMLAAACGDGTVRIWDSVPAAERWRQIRQAEAMRREAEPIVEGLFEELDDPLDVADRLRADAELSDEMRRAALRVLLERTAGMK
jgi:WD40 repeat protein